MTVSPLLIAAVLGGCLVVLGAALTLALVGANHHPHPEPEPESGPFRPALLVEIEAARVVVGGRAGVGRRADRSWRLAVRPERGRCVMGELESLRVQVAALTSALERTEANFRRAVNGTPVRDMAENLAENARALRVDTDPGRCDYYSLDGEVTRYPRDDGWRCGLTEGHPERHVLYRADGESVHWTNGKWARNTVD